ncbi:hypothetical protein IG193_02360 [Infirmifilum lucidum]|uniref:Uncharacterized protein n=1 Tax=Infirmifilum lucidum TaxID=2776706 RepID=A0A7L9FHX9_9CREN|nr:hypothetical protein [Infirmifilum lucidum]QOJ79327.1 hypothetical protein IG193_02360 [Infirmifilum lucidum]
MMLELSCLLGLALVVWALFSRRTTFSLLTMSAGSTIVALAISELAGWVPALLVAAFFAGALVALMVVWLVVVVREEARTDTVYTLALVFMFLTLFSLLLLIGTNRIKVGGGVSLRVAEDTDFALLAVLLLTVLLGGLHVVRGGRG